MELWSLMHFLMPRVFQSHREFKEWFSNPLTGMIEGSQEYNESLVKRLHKVGEGGTPKIWGRGAGRGLRPHSGGLGPALGQRLGKVVPGLVCTRGGVTAQS